MAKKIFWHDGTLETIRVTGPSRRRQCAVEVDISLYPHDRAPDRQPFTLVCTSVNTFDLTGDASELQDNAGAGNIVDGEIRDSAKGFEADIELTGGRLRIRGRTIRLKMRST